jgi:acetoin utilization deacetylase AcuC-like enzyme
VSCIINYLTETDLLTHKNIQVVNKINKVTREQLLLVHSEKYILNIENMFINESSYDDIYINEHTTDAAYIAAGGAILAIDKVMKEEW